VDYPWHFKSIYCESCQVEYSNCDMLLCCWFFHQFVAIWILSEGNHIWYQPILKLEDVLWYLACLSNHFNVISWCSSLIFFEQYIFKWTKMVSFLNNWLLWFSWAWDSKKCVLLVSVERTYVGKYQKKRNIVILILFASILTSFWFLVQVTCMMERSKWPTQEQLSLHNSLQCSVKQVPQHNILQLLILSPVPFPHHQPQKGSTLHVFAK